MPATPPLARHGIERPLALRVAVGRAARAGAPLSAPWALSWALCDPAIQFHVPAVRCPRELAELFGRRYSERYGEGMRLRPSKTRIEIRYLTASDSFSGPIEISIDLPDVVSMLAPSRKLRELLFECWDALRPYSRFLARNRSRPDTLLGVTFLPVEILEAVAPKDFFELRGRIDERLGDRERVSFTAADLLDRPIPDEDGGRCMRSALSAARILARAGFGMEPDPRFGGDRLTREDKVVVFRLREEEEHCRPSSTFTLASLLLKLGMAVAAVDGEVSVEQKRHLADYLNAGFRLDDSERRRLAARLEFLALKPPRVLGARKRFEALTGDERRQIGRFLVRVAWADGQVGPGEVKVLARAYRLLGQDPGLVHQEIHDARASTPPASGPVPVWRPEMRSSGHAIPAPVPDGQVESGEASGEEVADAEDAARLDRDTIDKKLEETAAVSALLSRIFADDEPVPEAAGGAEEDGIHRLDRAHAKLLQSLGERREWSREEYDDLARSLGLLPDGALDLLNDVAFDACDAPLAEGEDPIEIDLDVHRELTS